MSVKFTIHIHFNISQNLVENEISLLKCKTAFIPLYLLFVAGIVILEFIWIISLGKPDLGKNEGGERERGSRTGSGGDFCYFGHWLTGGPPPPVWWLQLLQLQSASLPPNTDLITLDHKLGSWFWKHEIIGTSLSTWRSKINLLYLQLFHFILLLKESVEIHQILLLLHFPSTTNMYQPPGKEKKTFRNFPLIKITRIQLAVGANTHQSKISFLFSCIALARGEMGGGSWYKKDH